MKTNYDLLDWLGEQAAMEIGNLVQYARKGRVSSQFFMGREYPWDPKMNAFGRWVTNVGGGKILHSF